MIPEMEKKKNILHIEFRFEFREWKFMKIYSKINFHNYPDNSRVEKRVAMRCWQVEIFL